MMKSWNLVAAQTTELYLCWPLPKFSAWETSERVSSDPEAGMGLALVAVGFLDMSTWGLGQARVWTVSIAPTEGPGE